MAQITETNAQYYQGAQGFRSNGGANYQTTFDTDLVFYTSDPADENYARNNFKVYSSATGMPGTYVEVAGNPEPYSVVNNEVIFTIPPIVGLFIVVQLKKLDGGLYGANEAEKAYGETVEENYGGYQYIKLNDIVDNFMVGYVGDGKIIQTCKKSDVVFFAKRSLQEFSYDTLKY